MARSAPARAATRSLVWLAVIIAALTAILGGGVLWSNATWGLKLALDLEGGTQIILAPELASGQTVTQEQLDQTVSIIRNRVDFAGVSEAEVTSQGGTNVVVSIPGVPDEATLARIKTSAQLTFRPVIATLPISQIVLPEEGAETPSDERTSEPVDGSDSAWITPALEAEFLAFDCSPLLEPEYTSNASPDEPFITCDARTGEKFILGPVEVSGERISDATSGLVPDSQGRPTNTPGVFITFDAQGTEEFRAVTQRLVGYGENDVRNRFAIVVDGWVISSPRTQAVITDGKPMISGGFASQAEAKELADQLKFGALPVSFTVQSQETVSATLGTAQLAAGLIAGLIGMVLVVIYSLFQYRLLGLVTIASLLVAAILTYLVIALMSWRYGYRLSLAGVAGLIIAIGLTADSFIVYFERIRDELRDGRQLPGAVEAGWKRALRTILSGKFISLLSAIVLYILAVGNVRGFAFTLGLTTVIDVLVVLLFTHPMLQLLAENRFFAGGHPLSGLDPRALGAVYRGRAEFRITPEKRRAGASREAQRRQSIAERKAAEQDAAAIGASSKGEDR